MRCEAAFRGDLRNFESNLGQFDSEQGNAVPPPADECRAVDDEHRVVVHHSATRYDERRKGKRLGGGRFRGLDHTLDRKLRRAAADAVDLEQV